MIITVKQLIEFLQTQPSDAHILIEDADGGSSDYLRADSLHESWERESTDDDTKKETIILLSNHKEK